MEKPAGQDEGAGPFPIQANTVQMSPAHACWGAELSLRLRESSPEQASCQTSRKIPFSLGQVLSGERTLPWGAVWGVHVGPRLHSPLGSCRITDLACRSGMMFHFEAGPCRLLFSFR